MRWVGARGRSGRERELGLSSMMMVGVDFLCCPEKCTNNALLEFSPGIRISLLGFGGASGAPESLKQA